MEHSAKCASTVCTAENRVLGGICGNQLAVCDLCLTVSDGERIAVIYTYPTVCRGFIQASSHIKTVGAQVQITGDLPLCGQYQICSQVVITGVGQVGRIQFCPGLGLVVVCALVGIQAGEGMGTCTVGMDFFGHGGCRNHRQHHTQRQGHCKNFLHKEPPYRIFACFFTGYLGGYSPSGLGGANF